MNNYYNAGGGGGCFEGSCMVKMGD